MKTLFLLLLFLISCTTEPGVQYVEYTGYEYTSLERETLKEINTYREGLGLFELQIIDHISFISKDHSEDMVNTNTISHKGFTNRSQNLQDVLNAKEVGEILAYNFSTAKSVVNAWKNSQGHREVMERNYTHFGISIRQNNVGKNYYTVMFIKK